MDFDAEILRAVNDGNKSLEDFKARIAGRLDALEFAEAKGRRPHVGGLSAGDPETMAQLDGFKTYIRTGDQREMKAASVGSGPDGGFAVPKVIDSMIESIAVNISPIRSIAQVVQISTQDYHKLVNIRGTSSSWVGETAARPATNTPQFKDVAPPMGEIYANLQATQVMLDDVFFNADQWLAEEAATEFVRAEGAAFISGTGIAQPMGFLTNPVAATADATRAFGTLEYFATGASGAFKTLSATVNPADDLFTLVSKLKAQYRKDAVWVMNKATLFQIMGFKDYQGRFVFNPATAPGMQDTLLGYPIVEAEDMPTIAANSYSMAFGNFSRGYLIVDRVGTRVIRDPFSNKPYVGFYITKRVGGSVLNSECIKLLKFGTS